MKMITKCIANVNRYYWEIVDPAPNRRYRIGMTDNAEDPTNIAGEIDIIGLDRLQLDPDNPNQRDEIDSLKASYQEFGQDKPVVVQDVLRELLERAGDDVPGFDDAFLKELMKGVETPEPPEPTEPPKVPVSRLGDLWCMGKHRLLCGDSTDEAAVARLMNGEAPSMLHTDPPYGISIVHVKDKGTAGRVGGSKPFGSTSGTSRKSSTGFDSARLGSVQRGPKSKNQIIQSNLYPEIKGDDRPFDPTPFLGFAPIVILWGANYYADKLPVLSSWICWDKREGITRNSFADCELAWSSTGKPARVFHHLWNGLHKGSQHGQRRTHPTEKPIALFEEIGRMYCPEGIWVDLYVGSGAQILAAERVGTSCYGTELEPAYIDVSVLRWQEYTGEEAVLEGGGTWYQVVEERASEPVSGEPT